MEEIPRAKRLGENIAKDRDRSGMAQIQLAERVGVSTAFISRVERGQKLIRVCVAEFEPKREIPSGL